MSSSSLVGKSSFKSLHYEFMFLLKIILSLILSLVDVELCIDAQEWCVPGIT